MKLYYVFFNRLAQKSLSLFSEKFNQLFRPLSIVLVLGLFSLPILATAQRDSLAVKSDSTPSVRLKARALGDRVLLRWAVDQPKAWQLANTGGFWVDRVTFMRDSQQVMNPNRKRLTIKPVDRKSVV